MLDAGQVLNSLYLSFVDRPHQGTTIPLSQSLHCVEKLKYVTQLAVQAILSGGYVS